jgi:hypothetical protein
MVIAKTMLEDAKAAIKSRKSKKNRSNGQKNKDQRTNNVESTQGMVFNDQSVISVRAFHLLQSV